MIAVVDQHRQEIETLCKRHRVRKLELFGSAARGDFDPQTSDLDFFVEFEPMGWKGLADRYFGVLHGLEDLFGFHVDLVDLSAETNRIFMDVASRNREVLYAA